MKRYQRLFILAISVLAVDQISKYWIMQNLAPQTYWLESSNPPIPVIEGFFYIVHIYNPGAAWGILDGASFWLGIVGFIALGAIYRFRKDLMLEKHFMQYAFGLLIGGIIGNMIDRFRFNHVVDFLDFHLPGYRYPAFNVADCGITIGVALYIIYNSRELFSSKNQTPEKIADPRSKKTRQTAQK